MTIIHIPTCSTAVLTGTYDMESNTVSLDVDNFSFSGKLCASDIDEIIEKLNELKYLII